MNSPLAVQEPMGLEHGLATPQRPERVVTVLFPAMRIYLRGFNTEGS